MRPTTFSALYLIPLDKLSLLEELECGACALYKRMSLNSKHAIFAGENWLCSVEGPKVILTMSHCRTNLAGFVCAVSNSDGRVCSTSTCVSSFRSNLSKQPMRGGTCIQKCRGQSDIESVLPSLLSCLSVQGIFDRFVALLWLLAIQLSWIHATLYLWSRWEGR